MGDADASWEGLQRALSDRAESCPAGGVAYIDSHTAGEPTRVLLQPVDGPDPTWPARIAGEPRGSGILVGVALQRPESAEATAKVHFFNNVGSLRMCVHATIGLVETLARAWPQGVVRTLRFETPAGPVSAERDGDGVVTVHNVESWWVREASVEVDGRTVRGDVAWAGNWFFLAHDPKGTIRRDQIGRLERFAADVRRALAAAGIQGSDGAEIDHIHLRVDVADAPSPVFVLCPGGEYDRSPCGTGTSALTAVLAHKGLLGQGDRLRVQSAVGSEFEAEFSETKRGVRPRVRGRAYITGQGWLLFDDADPFRNGL